MILNSNALKKTIYSPRLFYFVWVKIKKHEITVLSLNPGPLNMFGSISLFLSSISLLILSFILLSISHIPSLWSGMYFQLPKLNLHLSLLVFIFLFLTLFLSKRSRSTWIKGFFIFILFFIFIWCFLISRQTQQI